jgi:hypothetical protein
VRTPVEVLDSTRTHYGLGLGTKIREKIPVVLEEIK